MKFRPGGRPDLRLEKEMLRAGCTRIAAMDEVGRGALAGPVSVGVVVVTATIGRVPVGLKDSKLLTPPAREALVPFIRRWTPEHAIGHASPAEIDRIGIIAALRLAGRRALGQLGAPVDAVLLDGNHDYLTEPDQSLFALDDEVASEERRPAGGRLTPAAHDVGDVPLLVRTRIKADLTCAAVAGASVLAKTARDALLRELAPHHPQYQFHLNKGYGTTEHVAALLSHGPCDLHRRSWRLPTAADPEADEFLRLAADVDDGDDIGGGEGNGDSGPGGDERTGDRRISAERPRADAPSRGARPAITSAVRGRQVVVPEPGSGCGAPDDRAVGAAR